MKPPRSAGKGKILVVLVQRRYLGRGRCPLASIRQISENAWHIDLGVVNAYLWRWGDHLALIDTGMPWHGRQILQAVEEAGFQAGDIKEILITHADADHAGGLKYIREATQARVIVHAIEAMYFKGKWHRWPNLRHPLGIAYFPFFLILSQTVFRIPRFRPDLLVVDEEVLENGLQVIHTPGHTEGHMSLFAVNEGVLFVGDVINHRGGKLSLPPAIFTPKMEVVKDSLRKIARLKNVNVAGFGHGPVIEEGAGDKIRAFVAKVAPPRRRRRKAPPPRRAGVPRQPKAKE